ncbi:MAG: DUF4149 domain-containing protein [Hylemonella sp.]
MARVTMSSAWQGLAPWAAALWWGSLTSIGFMAVPLLFVHLPSPAMAGAMAARLFTAQTWMSVACALVLLLAARPRADAPSQGALVLPRAAILGGLLLALLLEFGVAPRIVARENLALWHRVGSALYGLQWLCAGWALWRLLRRRP